MPFSNPIIGGQSTLIRKAIQSENYAVDPVSGNVTGWQIARDGSASFTDLEVGNTLWGVDVDGNATFNTLSVTADDISIGGSNLLTDILAPYPRGLIAYGALQSGTAVSNGGETGVLELGFEAEDGRSYRFTCDTFLISSSAVGTTVGIRIRDGGSASPTTSSAIVGYSYATAGAAGFNALTFVRSFNCPGDIAVGTHRMLLSIYAIAGTATIYNNSTNKVRLTAEDIGITSDDTGVPNTGGGGTSPKKTYVTSFNSTWTGSYYGDNSRRSSNGTFYQGYYSGYPSNGNQRSMIGFDYGSIQSNLSGATIIKAELYMYFAHWYNNSGGTAVIGTHNSTAGSAPSTWGGNNNRLQSASWPKPGARWVNLGTTIGNEFKAGTTTGIVVGPGPSTSATYYGYANGYGQSYRPVLRFTYSK